MTGSKFAVALLSLLLSACLGRSPAPVFYTLSAVASADAAGMQADPLTLAVGPASLPLYLDRPQIATRIGNRVSYDEFRRWAAPLEAELLRVLGANLGVLMQTDRVAIYPTQPRFRVDYRVVLQVEQFDGDPGNEVVLRVRWVVSRPRAAEADAIVFSEIHQPVVGNDEDDYVEAHSEAVATLSREIAAQLRSLVEASTR